MNRQRINIAIIEPSDIIYEGLTNLLLKNESHYYIYKLSDLDELYNGCKTRITNIAIINPVALINKKHNFVKLKKTFKNIHWIGLIYTYFENDLTSMFDDLLTIHDPAATVVKKINRTLERYNSEELHKEELSNREVEVLIQLVKGLSNKEIADKLHISIHTVISHRKNIIEKTGIKSLPGLTIYAISKKIIPLESNSVSIIP